MYNCKAEAFARLGDFQSDVEYAQMAMEAGPDPTGYFESYLAVGFLACGRTDAAERSSRRAFGLAKSAGIEYLVLSIARNLGHTYRLTGRYNEAEATLTEALLHDQRTCPPGLTFTTEMALAKVYIDTGKHERALELLDPHFAMLNYLDSSRHALIHMLRGQLNLRRRDFDQALDDLQTGLENSTRQYSVAVGKTIELLITQALCETGKPEIALEKLNIMDYGIAKVRFRDEHNLAMARAHIGLGRFHDAKVAAEPVVAAYANQKWPYLHANALVLLAAAQSGLGEITAATTARREALRVFTEMGVPEAEDVRRLFAAGD